MAKELKDILPEPELRSNQDGETVVALVQNDGQVVGEVNFTRLWSGILDRFLGRQKKPELKSVP